MNVHAPPPLWKAIVVYYAVVCCVFAIVGVVSAGGAPVGALAGLGIAAASHFVPFVQPPQVEPTWLVLWVLAAVAVGYVGLRMLSGWARIVAVLAILAVWLGWGFVTLAISA